ncbi:hypothetical protein C7974DRAFT_208100 [Boeremia exigua]|uniref:uncharacterized protein n=1 Tax=Boeremia exigua TaxID=749465 RepID=UPI001E8D4B06|nr:uncharacterized protein C7974DRAFT_208100 [Boeremia exigua]KAH6625819.1 hypothetical protein C7974DRAFT_208100 [Boeremia exigua]
MKYILVASLLSSAALAAPFAQQGNGNANGGNTNGATNQQQGGATQGGATQQGNGQTQQQGTQNVPTGLGAGATGTNGQTPTAGDLATAVSNWMADTSMVSNFLNTGASIQNNAAFKQAALVAYNAEVDELNHKAIIDAANGAQPNVQAANSTLATGGAFMDVVNKLQIMSVQGQAAANNIDLINQNRCTNVLPNIDAYMASTGSTSQAVRPQVCDQTGVAGGVQSQGPTLPGQPAGTPQAAFAAAQALQQGTGNGQLNLQANGIPAAQAAAQAGNPPPQAGAATPQAGTAAPQTGVNGQQGAANTQGTGNTQTGANTQGTGNTQTGANTQGTGNTQTGVNGQQGAANTQGTGNTQTGANTQGTGNTQTGANTQGTGNTQTGANTQGTGNTQTGANGQQGAANTQTGANTQGTQGTNGQQTGNTQGTQTQGGAAAGGAAAGGAAAGSPAAAAAPAQSSAAAGGKNAGKGKGNKNKNN